MFLRKKRYHAYGHSHIRSIRVKNDKFIRIAKNHIILFCFIPHFFQMHCQHFSRLVVTRGLLWLLMYRQCSNYVLKPIVFQDVVSGSGKSTKFGKKLRNAKKRIANSFTKSTTLKDFYIEKYFWTKKHKSNHW